MSQVAFEAPVEDSVPKVDNTVAVGEDLDFQRRWWKFERVVWSFFVVILAADVLGLFGRGPLAKATQQTDDGALSMRYERIERASTPSIITIHIGQAAIHDGAVRLFVGESLLTKLGTQRISPQPASSVLGGGGITYTFPVTRAPATVELALQPSFSGIQHIWVQVQGGQALQGRVLVMP